MLRSKIKFDCFLVDIMTENSLVIVDGQRVSKAQFVCKSICLND